MIQHTCKSKFGAESFFWGGREGAKVQSYGSSQSSGSKISLFSKWSLDADGGGEDGQWMWMREKNDWLLSPCG